MRSKLLGFLLFLSIALNIGTVSVSAVASAVSGLFETVTGLGSVLGVVGDRLTNTQRKVTSLETELATAKSGTNRLQGELEAAKRHSVDLDTKVKATSKRNVELLDEVAVLRKDRLVTYRGNKRLLQDAVSDTSGRITSRTATGATRNLTATLGESWPVYGIAVIVAATSWELTDACLTMQDLHELDVAFNPERANEAGVREVCGMSVPSKNELWEQVKRSPSAAWATVSEAFPDVPSPDFSSATDLFRAIVTQW